MTVANDGRAGAMTSNHLQLLIGPRRGREIFVGAFIGLLAAGGTISQATASPSIVIDVPSGRVLEQVEATRPWYPASVTKLMTVYVALDAVRRGRLTLNTPLLVTNRAVRMAPSKMGFKPGVEVTLDNALKMLMVKSANDIAVTIAEGVSGSVEAFADEMNSAAQRLGMAQSHFVNPNGLPDNRQVTSARDMALLGRALYLEFPDEAGLFNIGAFKLGDMVVPTHNGILGRYPGADGMKTGFTCPAGFNLVASATRGGRKLIAVIFGARSARERTARVADLLDQGFASSNSYGSAAELPSVGGQAPNVRGEVCVRRSKKALAAAENEDMNAPIRSGDPRRSEAGLAPLFGGAPAAGPGNGAAIAALPRPMFEPVELFVGRAPGYVGPVAGPRPANMPISATAYAPAKPAEAEVASPLAADPAALPMRRGKASAHKHANVAPVPGAKASATIADAKKPTQAVKPAKVAKSAKSRKHAAAAPAHKAKSARPPAHAGGKSVQ